VTWVYALPSWVVVIGIVGCLSACSAAGLLVFWRVAPDADVDHNDVAGPVISTIGVILAVMLSFMVVTVWQEYDQAAALVETEAGEIADLYHEAAVLPSQPRAAIRAGLQRYVSLLVNQEWPLMRSGGTSDLARAAITNVAGVVEAYQPRTPAAQNAQADALMHAHQILDARRNRIFANQQSVPGLLWAVMWFMAIVTIGSVYFFRVQSRVAHLLMTVALAAVVGAIFVMIAELDLPFRGDLQIRPDAYTQDVVVFRAGF
jgi:hypothetical protein